MLVALCLITAETLTSPINDISKVKTRGAKIQNEKLTAQNYLEKGEIERIDTAAVKDTFILAELAYFNSKFNHALNLYRSIPLTSRDCNDAFTRIRLIKENTPENLETYVKAELLYRKGKLEESIKILKKLKQNHSNISTHTALLLLNIFESKKDYNAAIKEAKEFMAKFREHYKIPEVMMKMAYAYDNSGNKKEARRIYNEILIKYPKSPLAPLARIELEK